MDPLVSIGIPTYRRLEYLREAVASAQAQTYRSVEILVSDDGDSEELRAWVETAAKADPRVRYWRNPKRLGLAGNWNAVADAARGEFLVIIGDDDRLLPRFAEALMRARTPDAAVLFANHFVIDSAGARDLRLTTAFTRGYHREEMPRGELSNPQLWVWRNAVPMSSALIRTRDVQRLRFKEDLNTPEIELYARLAAEGAKFVFVPEYLGEYRVHPQSATTSGLWHDRLVKYLEPMPVPPDVEAAKRELMCALLVAAVSHKLQAGDAGGARKLVASRYYPSSHAPSVVAQRVAVALPGDLGTTLFRLARRLSFR